MARCVYCKKDCKKTVKYQGKVFCCQVCIGKYKESQKPEVCEFC